MRLMKARLIVALLLSSSAVLASAAESNQPVASPIRIDHDGLKKLLWQLLCGSSTFHDRTLFETIDTLHALGFHHIELSAGQSLSPDHKDVTVGPDMAQESVDALTAKLKEVHMDFVSYRQVALGSQEADARKVFEFAKKLRVKSIVCSPSTNSLEMLDRLATEYKINVALLNGANSPYSNCDAFLKAVEGRSQRIVFCADIAEWRRAGLTPVECVHKLSSRIIEVRLKDLHFQQEIADIADVLKELKGQNFKGAFCVQTERGSGPERIDSLATVVNRFTDFLTPLAAGGP